MPQCWLGPPRGLLRDSLEDAIGRVSLSAGHYFAVLIAYSRRVWGGRGPRGQGGKMRRPDEGVEAAGGPPVTPRGITLLKASLWFLRGSSAFGKPV